MYVYIMKNVIDKGIFEKVNIIIMGCIEHVLCYMSRVSLCAMCVCIILL